MWARVTRILLKNRGAVILSLLAITVVMGFFARKVELKYELAKLLPENDPAYVAHTTFKKTFGQDGTVLVIAAKDPDFYNLNKFSKWYDLGQRIKTIQVEVQHPDGSITKENAIDSVFSEASAVNIIKDKKSRQFRISPVLNAKPNSQRQLDSLRTVLSKLPFYKDILCKDSADIHLMTVLVNPKLFNSKFRGTLVQDIQAETEAYAEHFKELHYSGLPFIRSTTMNKVQAELKMFIGLAIGVSALLLLFFFRSIKVVLMSLLVVGIGVIWGLGTMGIAGYKLTILQGLIPPLLIVIGIPNCIYLINKYQQEYKHHGNKTKSLSRVIQKIGNTTLITNLTTAMGFGTFLFTYSDILKEFGMIAAINIILIFILSITIIPIIYSYMPPLKNRHTKHLDKKWLDWVVDRLVIWATSRRKIVYVISSTIVLLSIFGMTRMETTGNIVDDLPQDDQVVMDLRFFEKHFNGVMPFELVISSNDTVYKQYKLLERIEKIQKAVEKEPYLSRSLSLVDAVKFFTQAYSNGNEKAYKLKSPQFYGKQGKNRFSSYINNTLGNKREITTDFLDSTHKQTRISFQVADVGTKPMKNLVDRVSPIIDSILNPEAHSLEKFQLAENKQAAIQEIFTNHPWIKNRISKCFAKGNQELEQKLVEGDPLLYTLVNLDEFDQVLQNVVEQEKFKFEITGTSVVYTKGTAYLVNNLLISLAIAIFVIACIMAFLFHSWRMVVVSLSPNFLPLLATAALMGYFGIPIKPSTILVFSIAFGISVDDTIHFLAKYRQELKARNGVIRASVISALRETGVSMIYTSIVLFFGFTMFASSNFGGTQALGILVSVTLLVAMLTNLVLLPSLLLSFEKLLTKREFTNLGGINILEDNPTPELEIENA